jgi:hypothetical protein
MVAGILSHCGLYAGPNLLANRLDNPKGHFEDTRFLRINDMLLKKNGGSWSNPPRSLSYQGLKHLMVEFLDLAQWNSEGRIPVWKDPRGCLTFPLWYDLIHPEEVRIVFVARPLREAAVSLRTQYGGAIELWECLVYSYIHRAFKGFRRCADAKVFVTHFHTYFRDWRSELEKVTEFLGVKIPKCEEGWIENFITPELWHHRADDPRPIKVAGFREGSGI